jgi:hypothetical protein
LRYSKNPEFWLALIILLVTVIASAVFFVSWYNLTYFVGPFLFSHWFSLVGLLFISILLPIYIVLRRKRPQHSKTLLRIHVFGNLLSVLLITSHFAQHIGRLAGIFPYLDTGIVAFLITSIIVATGFLLRFQTTRKSGSYTKNIHRYMTVFFYLVIFVHTLHGFNII